MKPKKIALIVSVAIVVIVVATVIYCAMICRKSNYENDFEIYQADININGDTIVVFVTDWYIDGNNYVITGYDDVFRFKRTYIVDKTNAVLISTEEND